MPAANPVENEELIDDLEPRLFTVEEYYRMAEAGVLDEDERTELLDGVIVRVAAQSVKHAKVIGRLTGLLSKMLPRERFTVRVQLPLRLSTMSEPEPDFAVVPREAEDREDSHPTTAPLVLEVAYSSSRRDRKVKVRLYAQALVSEYVIVDVAKQTFGIYRDPDPAAGRYRSVTSLKRDDEWVCSSLPGLRLSLTALFD